MSRLLCWKVIEAGVGQSEGSETEGFPEMLREAATRSETSVRFPPPCTTI